MCPSPIPLRGRNRRPVRGALAGAWCTVLLVCGTVRDLGGEVPLCTPAQHPHIVAITTEGVIVVELLPAAAPAAVERLVRLVQGPVFDPEITGVGPHTETVGYYDGLQFDLASPGTSLATAVRPPADAILFETEVDNAALGLEQRKVADLAEAMQIWQLELFPAQARAPSNEAMHPRLRRWLELWATTFSADFLVGASRAEINEALGYRSKDGLDSRPVTRGSVSLEPLSPRWSTPRLVIALEDLPRLDGRRMVVGQVRQGLELADRIADRPLTPNKAARNRPLDPVTILEARIECRPSAHEPIAGKGAQ